MKFGSSLLSAVTFLSVVKSSVADFKHRCVSVTYNGDGGNTGTGGPSGDGTVIAEIPISFKDIGSDDVRVTCYLECVDATVSSFGVRAGNRDETVDNPQCASVQPITFRTVPSAEANGQFAPEVFINALIDFQDITIKCDCVDFDPAFRPKDKNFHCFSPGTTVQVQGQGEVSLGDLKVGSQVLTDAATQKYETVYAMAHKDMATPTDFLQLFMDSANKNPLEVTAGHFMYKQGQSSPVRADALQVGDIMEGGVELTKIGQVTLKGRVTPLTSSGKVVVNGQVQASTYIDYEHGTTLFGTDYTNAMSHLFISPFRLLCTANPSSDYCVKTNEEGIPTGLDFLNEYANSAMASNMFVQASMLAAFAFAAISAWGIECLLMIPFVAWVAALAFVSTKASGGKKQKTL